jgi:hypothetical protein
LLRALAKTEKETKLRALAKTEKETKLRERRTAVSHVEATILTATADAEQRALAEELAAEMAVAGYALGGPSQVFGAAGGGAQADYGEELVDLITQTIYPHKWEVNGGNCTIVYYRPLMCLVVTATGDVHGGVEGLLNGLR